MQFLYVCLRAHHFIYAHNFWKSRYWLQIALTFAILRSQSLNFNAKNSSHTFAFVPSSRPSHLISHSNISHTSDDSFVKSSILVLRLDAILSFYSLFYSVHRIHSAVLFAFVIFIFISLNCWHKRNCHNITLFANTDEEDERIRKNVFHLPYWTQQTIREYCNALQRNNSFSFHIHYSHSHLSLTIILIRISISPSRNILLSFHTWGTFIDNFIIIFNSIINTIVTYYHKHITTQQTHSVNAHEKRILRFEITVDKFSITDISYARISALIYYCENCYITFAIESTFAFISLNNTNMELYDNSKVIFVMKSRINTHNSLIEVLH